jgi:alpha-beta hydrolase superfamily lysophospholipase
VEHVVSRDGTPIAYERAGTGPLVVLVGGGLDDGTENAPLATELARHFTVVNYARRGRGGSGDTAPYAVAREIEDLAALIDGGPAHLFGASSGGALAPTLAHDAACLGDGRPPLARLAAVTRPVLVATGGVAGFFAEAADALTAALPVAERRVVGGQGHVADPAVLAAVLTEFFIR